jgi:hypothetical protein
MGGRITDVHATGETRIHTNFYEECQGQNLPAHVTLEDLQFIEHHM